ncbi:MAG: cytosine permease [Hyphomicrobiaceae bacterium]
MTAGLPDASWPLLPSERGWSGARLLIVLTVTAAAPWFFIIGGAIGLYLDLPMGTAAMLAGGLIGMGIVTLAVVPMATRYGIDSVAGAVPQFGTRGVVLVIIPQYLSILGWNATLLVFFGDNIAKLAELAGLRTATGAAIVPIATALACVLCYPVLRFGAAGIERVCRSLVLLIAGVGVWLIWLLVGEHSEAIAKAKPILASPDLWWNYAVGIEISIATSLSWWAYLGAIVRHTDRPSRAILPSMLGLGLTLPLLSIIGLASQLALGTTDASGWLATFGGPAYGAIALTLVALSNFGTVLAGAYAAALGLKQVPGVGRIGWNALILASLIPLLILSTTFADAVKAHFTTFLAFIGLAFGPICGVQIADYLLLRRQRLSLTGIYDRGSGTPYHFWHGLNPAAALALAAGCGAYLAILNPLTFATAPMFVWTTASLPAVAVAGLVHASLTWLLVRPAGLGDYPGPDRPKA